MVETPRVERTDGIVGGKPRISGTRVTVEAVKELRGLGLTPEEIADEFPTADLEGVKAALTYTETAVTA